MIPCQHRLMRLGTEHPIMTTTPSVVRLEGGGVPMHSTTLVSFEDEFVGFIAGGGISSQSTTKQKQAHLQILHMTAFKHMKISNSIQNIKRGRITFKVFALAFQPSR